MVNKPLNAIKANRSTLAKDLVSKVTDAACTDWASKVLIDMQAIMLSHKLSDALSTQLRSAGQETGDSRLKTLEAFIDTHRNDFVSLLNFSAFQAKTQEKTIINPSKSESLQAYLWLYLTAKKDFALPGDVTIDHMAYRGYSVDKVLGGEEGAQHKYRIVKNALEDAQGPLKGHHLSQLEFWGTPIWKEVLAALPDPDEAALAAHNSRMAQLDERFETSEEQHAAGNISQAEYDSEIESIATERRALENVKSELQAQYAERLMARISDETPAATP